MHEYGLMEAIVERARQECHARGGVVAARLRVEVGAFSMASRESLQMAFDVLSKGTELDGASLELVEVPGHARCEACGFSGSPADLGLAGEGLPAPILCPSCGSPLVVIAGAGLALAEIQLRDRGDRGWQESGGGRR